MSKNVGLYFNQYLRLRQPKSSVPWGNRGGKPSEEIVARRFGETGGSGQTEGEYVLCETGNS